MGINGFKIAQNASQRIYINGISTTAGTGGYVQSTNNPGDAMEFVAISTTEFMTLSMMGNITIV